jgi:DNA-binding NarL/FixJ family response regulator
MTQPMSHRPIRIELIGDVPLVTCGLAEMLLPHADSVVVLPSSSNGAGPDLVLHDPFLRRPATETADIGRRLRQRPPWVVWTWERYRWADTRRYSATPVGYLFKGLSAPDLVRDLLRIHRGEFVVTQTNGTTHEGPWVGYRHGLTRRQSDVLVGMVNGLSNREIAEQLMISLNTVKSYIRSAYDAIGVTTRAQAVVWAVEHGLRQPCREEQTTGAHWPRWDP